MYGTVKKLEKQKKELDKSSYAYVGLGLYYFP